MDELKIKSECLKRFVAGGIRKAIRSKLGYDIGVCFTDDIVLKIEDDGAHLCLGAKIDMSNEDLEKLRKQIIGL